MAKLTPDTILRLSEPVEKVYSNIVDALLVNIARHLKGGDSLSTVQWEVQKLSELGKLTEESARIIARLTGQNPELIMRALEGAVTDALVDVEPELKKGVSTGAITAPKSSTALASNSIRQALEAYDQQAVNKLNLVNTTMLESTLEQYRKIVANTVRIEQQMQRVQDTLNTAVGEVVTGVSSRRDALRKALEQVQKEGITGFYDRAGRSWSPEAYVNMEIRTTVHNTAVETVKLRQEDYGVEIFRVSRHSGARPLCYPYQGRYFSWDNTSGTFIDGEGKRHRYQGINTTSYGKPAGLFGINCGHHPITVIPGVSIPRERAKENKEENDEAYALSQKQRALERDIRYAKQREAMCKAAGDEEGAKIAKEKIKLAEANMDDFIGQTGRTRRTDREKIYTSL